MQSSDDDGWRSAARDVWYSLQDRGVFRVVAFLAGLVLWWWLHSR
jgi:hypothetical protein